jgi:hypothetical protein
MALDREVNIPDEVLDLASGRLIRADQVARVRDYLDHGGTWTSQAVAESMVDEMLTARSA